MPELGPEARAAWERQERELGLRRLRLGCIIAMFFTPPGVLIDYVMLGKWFSFFWWRIACTVAILPILWLSWRPFGARHYRSLGIALAMAPGACMVGIIQAAPELGSYYAGLIIVLLGVAVVMQWNRHQSIVAVALLLAMYVVVVLPDLPREQYRQFLNNFWFLLLSSIIVVIGSHVGHQVRLSEFELRFDLDRSRQELEVKNKRLHELDELKGRFFANISHELRTPLTLLLGPLEQLRQHPALGADARVRDYLETMSGNGLRLLKLINDLLDLVRLDAGHLRLHRLHIDVSSFTRGLMNSVRRYAEDRGLKVICDVSPELDSIWADPDKLEKVFLNLLFNSIKFTPAGGEVRLTGLRQDEKAVFRISDSGMGIQKEHLDHLFERFWQADTSAHRKYQGAGIGLALVKELVEAHGGSVVAESEVGRGTTMSVHLPIGRAEAAAEKSKGDPSADGTDNGDSAGDGAAEESGDAPPAAAPTEHVRPELAALYRRAELYASITPLRDTLRPWSPQQGGAKPQVLIVDDEPDMLRFLRTQVEDDYEVREAVDGNQATVLTAQYLPDAVVCDMMLPEKDGMQVCREVRANHATRAVPFLMLTARADDETKLKALSAGASDFLPKPFSSAELKLRLKNLVDAQRLQKELARQNKQLEATLEELRETELQLVQAGKMASLGRLSAGIIHEINNPLNFTRTGLHILEKHGRALPVEMQEEFLEILKDIQEGVARVGRIIGDLRQFSHPSQGEEGAFHEVDVADTVESALRFLSAEWKDGRVDVENLVDEDFAVRADRNKLVQVLLNLIQNAFDALRDHPPTDGSKGKVRITTTRDAGRRQIRIRDNGPGIPDHHLPHIFEPFYTTKEVGKGMGLGLSICYRLVDEAGGKISVDTQPGSFCEFVLDFPDRVPEIADEKRKEPQAFA